MTLATPRLRAIAIPAEHGGWGFLFEPILLGLLVIPSLSGFLLAVGIVGLFLMRQPLKIALVDARRGRRFARSGLAERVALAYGVVALIGLGGAVLTGSLWPLLPLALASPFLGIQLYYDFTNRSRSALPELTGPLALASTAAGIALAGGAPLIESCVLWGIIALRALPSILYVRARLRLEKGQPVRVEPAVFTHIVALVAGLLLAWANLAPWLILVTLVILLLRAALGLSRYRKPTPAKILGFREIGFGLLTVILVAAGFRLGL